MRHYDSSASAYEDMSNCEHLDNGNDMTLTQAANEVSLQRVTTQRVERATYETSMRHHGESVHACYVQGRRHLSRSNSTGMQPLQDPIFSS